MKNLEKIAAQYVLAALQAKQSESYGEEYGRSGHHLAGIILGARLTGTEEGKRLADLLTKWGRLLYEIDSDIDETTQKWRISPEEHKTLLNEVQAVAESLGEIELLQLASIFR